MIWMLASGEGEIELLIGTIIFVECRWWSLDIWPTHAGGGWSAIGCTRALAYNIDGLDVGQHFTELHD